MSEEARTAWRKTNLGALATKLVNGGTPPTDVPQFWQGPYPWITGADFTASGIGPIRRFVSDDAISQTATNLINRGQLLIVTRTGVGKLAIAPTDIAISQDITGFYIDDEQATAEFLYHRLKLGLEDLKKLNQGTSINGITRGDLVGYSLDLPPLPEQRRIATILTTLDEVIEATEKLVEKHQQIKEGLMHDLFTRGLWTRPELARGDHHGLPCEAAAQEGQLRPPPEEAPGLYQDSPLGLIPRVWGVRSFDEIVTAPICYGIVLEGPYTEGGVLVVAPYNVHGDWDYDLHRCAPEIDRSYARSRVVPGDVLLSVKGTIGRVGVVPAGFHGNISRGLARLRPSSQIRSDYLAQLLQAPGYSAYLGLAVVGSTRAELSIGPLRRLKVPIPSIREQSLMENALASSVADLEANKLHLAKLRQQKQGLMHDLLTGRVRVRELAPSES